MTNSNVSYYLSDGSVLFKILIGGTVAFLIAFIYLNDRLVREFKVSPQEVLGTNLPSYMEPGLSFRTEDGVVSQFIHPEENTRFSVIIDPSEEPKQNVKLNEDFIAKVRDYSATKDAPVEWSPFLLKFAAAQIDAKRATDVSNVKLNVNAREFSAQQFKFKTDYYLATVFNRADAQIMVFAFRPDVPVDSGMLEKFMSDVHIADGART